MVKGYDDHGKRVKICHMPLKDLLQAYHWRAPLNDNLKRFNWGKNRAYGGSGCLKNWPYSKLTHNGHNPF